MKKKYEKPLFIVESFQLDASIAASCSSQEFTALGYNENTCGYDKGIDHEWAFFNVVNCDFDLVGSGGDNNDTPCYHGPIITGVTFINS